MEHTTEEAIRQSKARNKSFWDAMDRYNKGVEADRAAQKPADPPPVDPPPVDPPLVDPPKKQFSTWEDFTRITGKPNPMAQQRNNPLITEEQFRNHKNLRNNYGSTKTNITIDGKTYPIMVTTNLSGHSDIEDDQTYALDPETGLIQAVEENWMGLPESKWKGTKGWVAPTFMGVGPEAEWLKTNPMPSKRGPLGGGYTPEYKQWLQQYETKRATGFKKQGGTMNRINYFQQGGATPQQDIQKQIVALVQAAMQGDQKATQTVNQIMEAAKAGDQKAAQLAQMIQAVAQKMQGQATAAKWGAKLGYIRSLKYARGGKTCPACQTLEKGDKVEKKACGGKKAKKHYFGGWL